MKNVLNLRVSFPLDSMSATRDVRSTLEEKSESKFLHQMQIAGWVLSEKAVSHLVPLWLNLIAWSAEIFRWNFIEQSARELPSTIDPLQWLKQMKHQNLKTFYSKSQNQNDVVHSTSLQLSHPKYQLWAARNVTCLPFSFLFSGHQNKNHSAQTWGLGCFYLDYSQPGWFCGLQPTDHPLRPGSHQWTHSIALSLFRWPEQLILSKNE